MRVIYLVTNVPRPDQVNALQLLELACKTTGSEDPRYREGDSDEPVMRFPPV